MVRSYRFIVSSIVIAIVVIAGLADPMGWIPKSVVNAAASKGALIVRNIREECEKRNAVQ